MVESESIPRAPWFRPDLITASRSQGADNDPKIFEEGKEGKAILYPSLAVRDRSAGQIKSPCTQQRKWQQR